MTIYMSIFKNLTDLRLMVICYKPHIKTMNNTIAYSDFQLYTSIIIMTIVVLILAFAKRKQTLQEKIQEHLEEELPTFEEISEAVFMGLPKLQKFFPKANARSSIFFKTEENTSVLALSQLLSDIFVRLGGEVVLSQAHEFDTHLFRVIFAQKRVIFGLMKGSSLPNSFLLRIDDE